MDTAKSSLMQKIASEKALSDALRAELLAALKEFKEKYTAERGCGLADRVDLWRTFAISGGASAAPKTSSRSPVR